MYAWIKRIGTRGDIIKLPAVIRDNLPMALFGTVFLFLTSAMARCLHYYTNVDFAIDSLFVSSQFHTGISMFWSLIGVAAMTAGSRLGNIRMRKMGALLLFLVAGKLFLVDMSLSSDLARAAAFLWVGGIMVAAGWFAPVLGEKVSGQSD